MKKRQWIYGFILAMAFATASTSYANAYYDDDSYEDDWDDDDYEWDDEDEDSDEADDEYVSESGSGWETPDYFSYGVDLDDAEDMGYEVKYEDGSIYFRIHGSEAPAGWHKWYEWEEVLYGYTVTDWVYVIPNSGGKLLTNTWVKESDGKIYWLGPVCTKARDDVTISETYDPEHPNQYLDLASWTYQPFPYDLASCSNVVTMSANGGGSYDQLMYILSGQDAKDQAAKWEQWMSGINDNAQQSSISADTEAQIWTNADRYISQAIADNQKYGKGLYGYKKIERRQVEPYVYGSYRVVYHVDFYTKSGSTEGRSLVIYLNADGSYNQSSID